MPRKVAVAAQNPLFTFDDICSGAAAMEDEGAALDCHGQFVTLPEAQLRIVDRVEFARRIRQGPEDPLRDGRCLVEKEGCLANRTQLVHVLLRIDDKDQPVMRIACPMEDGPPPKLFCTAIPLYGPSG